MRCFTGTPSDAKHWAAVSFLNYEPMRVDVGKWHSKSNNGHPLLVTRELGDVVMDLRISQKSIADLQREFQPNLPWAENHFRERISGVPHNPPPSHVEWPHAHSQHQTVEGEKFSHTYPERYWPKWPGEMWQSDSVAWEPRGGIRFDYGDLDDIIKLLSQEPLTRQAYLPVYFPEDTGLDVRHPGERVPCSLGYQFIMRDDRLHCKYFLRSCDFLRHWSDDMYMTARLLQYVAGCVDTLPGVLTTFITSLHIMEGDLKMLQHKLSVGEI